MIYILRNENYAHYCIAECASHFASGVSVSNGFNHRNYEMNCKLRERKIEPKNLCKKMNNDQRINGERRGVGRCTVKKRTHFITLNFF